MRVICFIVFLLEKVALRMCKGIVAVLLFMRSADGVMYYLPTFMSSILNTRGEKGLICPVSRSP